MKTIGVLLAATLFASLAALGQGQFYFNNRIEGELDERIFHWHDPAGVSRIGTPDWSVLLFGGPHGTPVANLVPLEPPSTTFLGAPGSEAAGYVVGLILTVPGVPPGGNADVLVRIVGPGISMDQGPFGPVGLGGGGVPIPTLPFTYNIIPEPATPVLALVAVAVFLVAKASRSFRNGNGSEKGQTDSV